jgi:catechol 2,3-dioxygenase-like lactoylglutathione lyase family enzyme
MIQRLSHVTILVNNQEEAKEFYVGKLGLEVRTDHTMEGGPMLDEEALAAVKVLLRKQLLGAGVFQVDDCRKTYRELKQKGVHFAGAPEDRFYGIEAVMKDGLGNWFSMTQPKDWQAGKA